MLGSHVGTPTGKGIQPLVFRDPAYVGVSWQARVRRATEGKQRRGKELRWPLFRHKPLGSTLAPTQKAENWACVLSELSSSQILLEKTVRQAVWGQVEGT